MATTSPKTTPRQRIPAAERREALIDAAVHEFAVSGYHGTPVDRIARSVGVAQPYVFSLFGSKRELFIAAVHRCFERGIGVLSRAAAGYDPADPVVIATAAASMKASGEEFTKLKWMGGAYIETLRDDRDLFMLQLQAFAACDDEAIRVAVRTDYAQLIREVQRLVPEAGEEEIDNFARYGAWINQMAAMGLEDVKTGCEWVRDEPLPGDA